MRFVFSDARWLAASLVLPLALSACGDKNETANSSAVQMKDFEAVDGTINDAMTDLDGVRTEGTAMADMGSDTATGNGAVSAGKAKESNANSAAPEQDTEVVVDQ